MLQRVQAFNFIVWHRMISIIRTYAYSLQCVLYTLEIYDTSLYIHDGYIFDLLITYDTHCLQVWCIVMITSTWLFYSYIMVIVTSTALIHHGHLICLPNFVIMINIDNY